MCVTVTWNVLKCTNSACRMALKPNVLRFNRFASYTVSQNENDVRPKYVDAYRIFHMLLGKHDTHVLYDTTAMLVAIGFCKVLVCLYTPLKCAASSKYIIAFCKASLTGVNLVHEHKPQLHN